MTRSTRSSRRRLRDSQPTEHRLVAEGRAPELDAASAAAIAAASAKAGFPPIDPAAPEAGGEPDGEGPAEQSQSGGESSPPQS